MLMPRLLAAVILTILGCSVEQGSQFSSSSQRATKEVIEVSDGQVGVDSDGNADASNGSVGNDADGTYVLDESGKNGGSSSTIGVDEKTSSSNSNVSGSLGGHISADIADLVDPNIIKCEYKCASPDVSMYRNGIGGWLTRRWRKLAPGKLVCLDHSTCPAFDDCRSGKLYSYDPANNCERSANEVGTRDSDGCFDPESKIQMSDGSLRAIKNIRAGDLVYNPITKKSMSVKNLIKGPEKNAMYLIEHAKGRTLVTAKHPFLLKSGKVKMADELLKGDLVADAKGEWYKLTKVEAQAINPTQQVWNFTFKLDSKDPRDHIVVADGVAAGDLWLQIDVSKKSIAKK
jgi:hypothetical protein